MGFFDFLNPKKSLYEYKLVEFQGDEGFGYVVVRTSDGQKLSWQTLPRGDGLESINVVGEKYRLENLQQPCFCVGSSVVLVPEPDNLYDKNAIAVYDINKKFHAGYIPASDSKRILKKLNNGEIEHCIVMWETIKFKKRVQIRLLLIGKNASISEPF